VSGGAFGENVLLFGRLLRSAGLEVHHARLLDALRALEWVGVRSRADVAATLRSLLVHNHGDLAAFDQAFDHFFRDHQPPAPGPPLFSLGERPRVVVKPAPGTPVRLEADESARASPSGRAVGAWSPLGLSRTKDFADYSSAELERARRLLEDLPWAIGRRRTRRWSRAGRGSVDLRRVLRRNILRDGDLIDLPARRRRESARPIVLLGDISGSMERYSQVLLHFVYGLAHSGTRVESFVFATRLTRVTRHLASGRGGAALARVARDVQDWGGGTRIGEALRTFNLQWARRVARNGPIVLIVSDGWDRGDPLLLAAEMRRLRRSCKRLIWLNPLLGSAQYEPLTRGMQAALRHVDEFLPVHNLESLERLAVALITTRQRQYPISNAQYPVGTG
jgi:uncharacterized protein with von Willebrand factor type A (vWA) domain